MADPRPEPVIDVRGLTKRYGGMAAVADLSFSLGRGTIAAFLGPNGAGKSTTLRLLLGLSFPSGGEALVLGRRYRDLDEPLGSVGAMLGADDAHPRRSAHDHLHVLALAGGIPAARVAEVLEIVGLDAVARARVGSYSLGMRRRLGLAAALLGDPDVLILDEPSNGLDPAGARWLRATLREFAGRGGTVLFASHALDEVSELADHAVVIDRGRLVAHGPLADLFGRAETLEAGYLDLIAPPAS